MRLSGRASSTTDQLRGMMSLLALGASRTSGGRAGNRDDGRQSVSAGRAWEASICYVLEVGVGELARVVPSMIGARGWGDRGSWMAGVPYQARRGTRTAPCGSNPEGPPASIDANR